MQSLQRLDIPGSDVTLVADAAGPVGAPPIVFLHGGGQTRQSWGGAVQEAAQRGFRAISLDLRGHGESGWSADGHYDLAHFVVDVRRTVEYIGARAVLVGASLGGLVGLELAAASPRLVRALVLVDITPRIEPDGSNEVAAFMQSAPDGFGSLEEAADAVSAYLPHRQRPKDTSGLGRNLRLRGGRYYWHWDPAFMRSGRRTAEQPGAANPLEAAARRLTVPTLLIRGGRSRIVSEAGVREFRTMVPHAEFVDIPGADHMVAGDANDAFNQAVLTFAAGLPSE